MYSPAQFSKMIGKSVPTLQRCDREGRFIAHRNSKSRRYYTHDQYLEYIGAKASDEKGRIVVNSRVSSSSQKRAKRGGKKRTPIFSSQEMCGCPILFLFFHLFFPLPMNGNSLQRHTLSLHSDTNIINRLWIWVSIPGPQPPYVNIRCGSFFKIAKSWPDL